MSDDLSLDARVLRFRSDGDAERGPAFARELLEARRPREALEVLSRAVAARPDDPELLRLAARALLAEDADRWPDWMRFRLLRRALLGVCRLPGPSLDRLVLNARRWRSRA